jgi:serine/threonine protein kinase
MPNRIVEFVRKKDLIFVEELGQGACGKTVILYDEIIDERFVCKKYSPSYESFKQELFGNFIREIKLLHTLNHPNIVRIFNYYLYPEQFAGYILMELVKGEDIERYLTVNPDQINQIFLQVIDGFNHLEKCGVLHRDIRPKNILVSDEGVTKIIDFGFGKRIATNQDFDKSITLNWWCDPPLDFADQTYNYTTEVYFIGKLFEKIIFGASIEQFAYKQLLSRMCASDPSRRIESFSKIQQEILTGKFVDMPFSDDDLVAYRDFATDITSAISKIEQSTKYFDNVHDIERKLEDVCYKVMLEEWLPDINIVIRCFLNGSYYYSKRNSVEVSNLRRFVRFFRSCSRENKSIVLSNIFTRLDAITRYHEETSFDEDVPF